MYLYTQINLYILVWASVVCTLFPLVYSLVPWYTSLYGRAMMFSGISLAVMMDVSLVFRLNPPSPQVFLNVTSVLYLLIGLAMLYKLILFYNLYLSMYRKHLTPKEIYHDASVE